MILMDRAALEHQKLDPHLIVYVNLDTTPTLRQGLSLLVIVVLPVQQVQAALLMVQRPLPRAKRALPAPTQPRGKRNAYLVAQGPTTAVLEVFVMPVLPESMSQRQGHRMYRPALAALQGHTILPLGHQPAQPVKRDLTSCPLPLAPHRFIPRVNIVPREPTARLVVFPLSQAASRALREGTVLEP